MVLFSYGSLTLNHNLVPNALAAGSQLLLITQLVVGRIQTGCNDVIAVDANNLKHRILIFLHIRNHFNCLTSVCY